MNDISEFSFGLHIICKNEAHIIGRLLENVDKAFDQVVVVDTGSTDGTIEFIKAKFPKVEVYEFKWTNSFAEARNFALSKLRTTTAMWLDSDDTFETTNAKEWRKLAKKIFKLKKKHYVILPYHYAVDANDEPVLLQYRERIITDLDCWEWRNDIHEILCQKDGYTATPIMVPYAHITHRPTNLTRDVIRNWRILHKVVIEGGEKDLRTLYYIQREALDKGQEEYSINIGEQVIALNPDGYYEYEGYKHLGDAYARLYNRDNIESYSKQAEKYYKLAIEADPARNEARDALVHFYIDTEKFMNALDAANNMHEFPSPNIATLSMDKYMSYKHAILAKIYFNYFTHISSAFHAHLKSLDFPTIADQALNNDLSIRQYMDNYNIGVVYADTKYFDQAMWVKNALISKGVFSDVIISNNPIALGFSRYWYFHITDDENTCYLEDSKPDVIKFLLHDSKEEKPVNFYERFPIPKTKHDVGFIFEEIMGQVDIGRFDAVSELLEHAKSSYKPIQVGLFTNKLTQTQPLLDLLIGDDGIHGQLKILVNDKMELLAIVANTNTLVEIAAEDEIVYVDRDCKLDIIPISKYNIKNFKGISFKIKPLTKDAGKVAFYAGGMEPWDGCTPYKTGIGASETSLIYVAEELVKSGYDVAVYNMVPNPIKVAGVQYLPSAFFNNVPRNLDLLVSSRCPGLLENSRLAKKQVLWMHDLPEVYRDITPNHNIDLFICVSDWAKKRFFEIHPSIPQWKVTYIPNAIHKNRRDNSIKREKGRLAWISSPDRGALDLVECWMNSDPNKDVLKDLFVFYGFHNLRIGYLHDVNMFKHIYRTKFIFRQSGAKLLGRVPIQNVKNFLQTVDMLPYTSSFGETYCVSVVEALHAGVNIIINNNGATLETAIATSEKGKENDLITLPTNTQHYQKEYIKYWKQAMINDFEFENRDISAISDNHTWKSVTQRYWIGLIKTGAVCGE